MPILEFFFGYTKAPAAADEQRLNVCPSRNSIEHEDVQWQWNHTINRAAFVCLSVCLSVCLFVPYLLRGPLTDLRQTWWVYVGGPRIALEGFFFEKVNGSTGQRVTFTFRYIIYVPASLHTAAKGDFAATASN